MFGRLILETRCMSSSEDENTIPSPSPPTNEHRALGTTTNTSDSKTGLLSNVLSFVSREITEFVVNAAGVAEVGLLPFHTFY